MDDKSNLSHGEFLPGSFKILIHCVDGLLELLRGSCHLLLFYSKWGNLFPVALNIVLEHLIPASVEKAVAL